MIDVDLNGLDQDAINTVQSNLRGVKTNFQVGTHKAGIVQYQSGSSYLDIVIQIQYYSKLNTTRIYRKLVCIMQNFVLRVFFLMRFYCRLGGHECSHSQYMQELMQKETEPMHFHL